MACLVLAVALTSCGDNPAFDEQWAAEQRVDELEEELDQRWWGAADELSSD